MEKKEIKINMVSIVLIIIILVLVCTLGYALLQIKDLNKEITYAQQSLLNNQENIKNVEKILTYKDENSSNREISELKDKITSLEKQLAEKSDNISLLQKQLNEKKDDKISKIDENKDLVYTITKNVKIGDPEGTRQLEIPQINLNCDNIIDFNKKLLSFYDDDFLALSSNPIKYYINDNVISILLHWVTPGDNESYNIYNVDTTTGTLIALDDLLYMKGISREKFNEKVKSETSRIIEERVSPSINNQSDGLVWKVYTSSLNNVDTIPAFVNENGILCVQLLYAAPAGSGGPWPVLVEIK